MDYVKTLQKTPSVFDMISSLNVMEFYPVTWRFISKKSTVVLVKLHEIHNVNMKQVVSNENCTFIANNWEGICDFAILILHGCQSRVMSNMVAWKSTKKMNTIRNDKIIITDIGNSWSSALLHEKHFESRH